MTECPLAKLVARCLSEKIKTDFILTFTISGEGKKGRIIGFICLTLEAWNILKFGFFLDWTYFCQYADCGILD